MDKQNADRIITEYLQRIYGFALSKTRDSYEAEELASDITYEVYLSLLRDGMIYNVNSYIWRISSFVFARWVEKKSQVRERGGISVDEVMEQVAKTGARMPLALIDTEDAERAERAAHEDSLRLLRIIYSLYSMICIIRQFFSVRALWREQQGIAARTDESNNAEI